MSSRREFLKGMLGAATAVGLAKSVKAEEKSKVDDLTPTVSMGTVAYPGPDYAPVGSMYVSGGTISIKESRDRWLQTGVPEFKGYSPGAGGS